MLGGGDEGRRVGDGGRAWRAGPGTVVEAQGQRMTWGHTSVQHRAAAAPPTMPRASPRPRPVPPGGARASESLLGLCPEEPPASLVQTPPRAHHQALAQGLAPCPNPSLAGLPVSALLSTSHSPPKNERGLRGGSPGSPRPRAGSPRAPTVPRPTGHQASTAAACLGLSSVPCSFLPPDHRTCCPHCPACLPSGFSRPIRPT